MTIQYCSDLHIEFPKNKKFLKENPIIPTGDILILAGDIVPFSIMDKHNDFFKFCSDNFKETYWIAGNHEYYGFDITQKSGAFHEKIKSNVHLLNNTSIQIGDTQLIFTTLWTKINPAHQWQIERGMNDFRAIRYGRFRFTTDRFNDLHLENLLFLNKALKESKLKNSIVVTHHVPTFQNYPQQYRGSILNEAFAVELTDLIVEYKPNYWIYGHHHENIPEFKIHETTMLTNQLGYVEMGENKDFNQEKIIKS
ncbi:metallophosphoesterase [Brumimicrobium glaciale]|uniref:Metallophosphoesterase n=1 Tax=Brumimicrobium glaciale TaxID=200475 RepID=A0A4Q4KKK3_9FLAO|nr:metallophosphoesterase [Brumimicrobium glaciale]RYM32834.1 metallophosphoesterase [Brumimicrobium glaciale]